MLRWPATPTRTVTLFPFRTYFRSRWGWSRSGTRPGDIGALMLLSEDRAALSFGWRGKRDCAGFAAAAIEAQTGVEVLAGLSWSKRGGALAVLDAGGGMDTAMDPIQRAECRARVCSYV